MTDREEVIELIKVGTQHRTTGVTDQNKVSSRSHAVLQFYVTVDNKIVKLTMIDLAGSERIHSTLNIKQPKQIIEGSCINRSLLALGNCIAGLVKLQTKSTLPPQYPSLRGNLVQPAQQVLDYIPYRDSKLTRILKDSLIDV